MVRRILLIKLYLTFIRCGCEVCDLDNETSEEEDKLRKEAWDLSLMRSEMHVTDDCELPFTSIDYP